MVRVEHMKRYIKSSVGEDVPTLAVIEIEFDVTQYLQAVFSSDELDIATGVISDEIMDTYESFVDNAIATISSYGFIVDYDKPSPKNKEDQWSYYIYFHHPEDESETRINVEIKLKLTDHKFTKFDKDGNIVLDRTREAKHLREGSRIDRDELEAKLRKLVIKIKPTKVTLDGESVTSLYAGLHDLETILEELSEEIQLLYL